MTDFLHRLIAQAVNLFDAPPLASMTFLQKIGRIANLSIFLVTGCLLFAMVGATGIFLLQRGSELLNAASNLTEALGIIFVSICVNAICVVVLFEISKTDRELLPTSATPAKH